VTPTFSAPEFRDEEVVIRLSIHFTQFTVAFTNFGIVGNILASWNEKRLKIKYRTTESIEISDLHKSKYNEHFGNDILDHWL
jgi:hypothetical protein